MVHISRSESVVMEALWRKSPQAAEEVLAEVGPATAWGMATVKTLLNRLLKKGALAADKDGRRFLYRPAVTREAYVRAESKGLVDRLFDGRLAPLVAHFAAHKALTPDEIAEIRRLIDGLDDAP